MRITGVTNSALIARAYGVTPASRPAPIHQTQTVGRVEQVNQVERSINTRAARLIAGVVPGGISFESCDCDSAAPVEKLVFYRRPADQNAAATSINVGQRLDATG